MSMLPSSFRDPSGSVFYENGKIFRKINNIYQDNYELLMSSGLYRALTDQEYLIKHKEVNADLEKDIYKIVRPEMIDFISYPYEWSFSQLKDAAILTLNIQKMAIEHGLSLKDASAYNIQFHKGKPILIDTLSFERYKPGSVWYAYRQFCQHFLAPLALMSSGKIWVNQLFCIYLDGIPLKLAADMLPHRSKLKLSQLLHIHLHSRSQEHYSNKQGQLPEIKRQMNINALKGLIDSLLSAVYKLKWHPQGTTWADYYSDNNYSAEAFANKKRIIEEILNKSKPRSMWDFGANTGIFSRIASSIGIPVIAFDIDPAAVELNYLVAQKSQDPYLLPLLMDITNPSPGIGWENNERMPLLGRGPTDMIMALALIHHLSIGNNLPFNKIASFFAGLGQKLIIEFVPKNDSQIKKLLACREDIFKEYSADKFEADFSEHFNIIERQEIIGSGRSIYHMQRKSSKQ